MERTAEQFMENWLKLNNQMIDRNFTWSMLEDEEDFHQYMTDTVKVFSQKEFDDIKIATAKIGNIVNKTYQYILKRPELQAKLGLPEGTLDAVQIPSELFSYFTRLDLIVNNGDIKVIEINCDTPTGYLETSVANDIICRSQGLNSPNELELNIFKAWRKLEKAYGIEGEIVHFTSYGEHEEDKQTVLFNMMCSGVDGRYIAVEDILIDENGLYDQAGNKIENLYRLYPLEFLPDEVGEDGKPIGQMFLDHIANGNVKIINPPSAFMMQTKAVMALIWELKDEEFLTKGETRDVEKYFIPTYFDEYHFTSGVYAKPFVEKPIFGREGGGVKIVDKNFNIVEEDEEGWYREYPFIYQEYVEMPDFTVDTWDGDYTGKLLVGSFLIGGEPSGVFLRVGEKITGNLSMFCGVAVDEEEGLCK